MTGSVTIAYSLQATSLVLSVSGFALACLAHRRSTATRPPNLRILLSRESNALHDRAAKLKKPLRRSNGPNHGDTPPLDAEGRALADLIAQLPRGDEHFFRLSEAEMEAKLVELHAISLELSRIQASLRNSKGAPKHEMES